MMDNDETKSAIRSTGRGRCQRATNAEVGLDRRRMHTAGQAMCVFQPLCPNGTLSGFVLDFSHNLMQ